jgi:hypothetical protein
VTTEFGGYFVCRGSPEGDRPVCHLFYFVTCFTLSPVLLSPVLLPAWRAAGVEPMVALRNE